MEQKYPEDFSAGYSAFYNNRNLQVLPKIPPDDIEKFIEYEKRKSWVQGWINAKEDYTMRTAK